MSECACVYVDTDSGERCDFHAEEMRMARKQHRCDECRRTIEPGERYEYARGRWGKEFEAFKTCADCLSIRNTLFCGGWFYGMLLEDLATHVSDMGGEISETCLATLTPRARGMVCEMIEGIWEDAED